MTRPSIAVAIDYLASCPEFLDALAQLSWKEWQEIYQQREQTLDDCLKNYRERMNRDRLPLTLVAVQARHDESLTGRAGNYGAASELIGMVSLKYHDIYPAGFGPLARRAFSASGMEKPGRGNNADASRYRRGSPIEGAATLSLDAFSRRALPQTWLAGRRTERLLQQGSGRDADRSRLPIATLAR